MKKAIVATLLVLANCAPDSGGSLPPLIPVESAPQVSNKKPDTLPPLPDPKVSISSPSTSTLPEEVAVPQVPLISQEVPTKENEIAPPPLATSTSTGSPIINEVASTQQNPTDLSTQISVPIPVPQTIISPEVALAISSSVQEIAPSAPVPTSTSTSTTTSSSASTSTNVNTIATFVGAVEASTGTVTATGTGTQTSTETASSTATSTSTDQVATSTASTSTSSPNPVPTPIVEDLSWQSEITSDIADKELNVSRCATYSQTLDTSDGVWYTTPTSGTVSGIETYWADQNLWVNFRGICKRGYYRVQFQVKNTKGTLPSSYTKFEVSVMNKSLSFGHKNKKIVGLAEITASTSDYRQGSTRVWLEPGENKILVQWKNDYNMNGFDSNIQIKKIWLEPVVTTEVLDLNRLGVQFSDLQQNGSEWKWYWKDDYLHTFWNDVWSTYTFDLKNMRYKVTLGVRSFGGTTVSGSWKFKVVAGSNETIVTVPGSKDFKTGYSFIQIPNGTKTIKVTWLNPDLPNVYPQIRNISMEEAP